MKELESEELSLDQFEALRLCDVERLEQEEAGRKMGVSRGTVQRLLYSGRKLLVDAITKNNAIIINLKGSEASDDIVHTHQRRRRNR